MPLPVPLNARCCTIGSEGALEPLVQSCFWLSVKETELRGVTCRLAGVGEDSLWGEADVHFVSRWVGY